MTSKQIIFMFVIVIGLTLVFIAATFHGNNITCQEDMPCWNCKTMGNHICGPGVTP